MKVISSKRVTKNNKKLKRSTKTACYYDVFFVIKQPPACVLRGIVVSYGHSGQILRGIVVSYGHSGQIICIRRQEGGKL